MDSESAQARFGRRLRHWREVSGLSQRQLGGRLGYDHTAISRVEAGQRWPTRELAIRADELLRARGELMSLWPEVVEDRTRRRIGPWPTTTRTITAPQGNQLWQFPVLGIACPRHGHSGCTATVPEAAPQSVHDFTALLAAYTRAHLDGSDSTTLESVESCLYRIARLSETSNTAVARQLRYLNAHYAHLAGWLRVEQGQRGLGMLWFGRGVDWGRASGNVAAVCECLARMSLVARLERDARCAMEYAEAIRGEGPGRTWPGLLADAYLVRAFAISGDVDSLFEHAGSARSALDRLGADSVEVPWLCGARGLCFVESSLSAAFRDIADSRGDHRTAGQAVEAARVAMDNVQARMRPTEALLTLRLADAHACAGELDAAITTAEQVLPYAVATRTTLIGGELRGLRDRLTRHCGGAAEVRDFLERLRVARI